jgi:hypothetical protein
MVVDFGDISTVLCANNNLVFDVAELCVAQFLVVGLVVVREHWLDVV